MHRIWHLPVARAGLTILAACIAVSLTSEIAYAQRKFWNTAKATGVDLLTKPTISVELQKWRKHSTLVVDATVRSLATDEVLYVEPTVNGVSLDPNFQIALQCNGYCFVAARWVLDLDEANVANPGVFTANGASGLPMTIELEAGITGQVNSTGYMLLTAELKKNK